MRRVTGTDCNFIRSIMSKIGRIRKKYGSSNSTTPEFLQQGTSYLTGLPPEMVLKIKQAKDRMDDHLPQDPITTSSDLQESHLSNEDVPALSMLDETVLIMNHQAPNGITQAGVDYVRNANRSLPSCKI